jgi:hypothetical protein
MSSENALMNNSREMRALHRVLARARTQAYQGVSAAVMGRILDDAHYMVEMLAENTPEPSKELRDLLVDMEQRYEGFGGIVAAFDDDSAGANVFAVSLRNDSKQTEEQ